MKFFVRLTHFETQLLNVGVVRHLNGDANSTWDINGKTESGTSFPPETCPTPDLPKIDLTLLKLRY